MGRDISLSWIKIKNRILPHMKKLCLAALISGLFFLSACITITEKYTIHKNGSGTMEYIIDMSEMYEMMSAFSDSSTEKENPEIDQSFRESVSGIRGIDGISNVELTGNIEKYIAGIKFDFQDANSLNQALALLFKKEGSTAEVKKYVDISRKTFTRYNLTSEEFNKEDLLSSQELDPETMKSVLESMKYKIIVNFDKPVKKVTTLAPFTQEGKMVTIETNFSEIFDQSNFLHTKIKTR
jgi:hypothetical protein